MRRLSGMIAILALSRLVLSGVPAVCPASPVSPMTHHAHSSSATRPDAAQHDERSSHESDGATDCGDAQHQDCLAMASCATALASPCDATVFAPASTGRASTFVVAVLLEPSRTPDPPPPRA